MSIAVLSFTRKGALLGAKLGERLPDTAVYTIDRLAEELHQRPCGSLTAWTEAHFAADDALIFVSATGIAVRAIAPLVRDKFTDPAVLSVDETGRFVVPLLSGHVGGANALARQIAALTGGTAVLSTATDVNELFAVDVWAKSQNLVIGSREMAKRVSAALLEGEWVGFSSEVPVAGELPRGIVGNQGLQTGICVTIHTDQRPYGNTLSLYPRALVLGVGCKRDLPAGHVKHVVCQLLAEHHLASEAVCLIASIDLKAEDSGIRLLAEALNAERVFYPAAQLRAVQGDFTPSAFVRAVTGVDNVCERSAVLASGGCLLLRKQSRQGVTLAVAVKSVPLTF